MRRSLTLLVSRGGYHVEAFEGADDVLQSDALREFALFVIDLKLEASDGRSLLAAIRAHGIAAPAILITGWEPGLTLSEAIAAGFDAFVRKPMLDMSIIEEINRLVH